MKKERKPWSRRKKIWMSVLFVFLAFVASVGLQFGYNMLFVTPVGDSDLASDATDGLEQMLHDSLTLSDAYFADSATVSSALSGTIQELNYRNDCSDFDANALLRIYLENQNRLDEKNKNEIKTCLLKFKYWPSEGDGRDDGMCFWSENHQLMFSVADYLAGNLWKDETFCDGRKGSEHVTLAKSRIEAWMELRFTYGFSEYYSNNYYPEDIGPMSNFIQYASSDDETMRSKMKIILDLLFYDLASQSWKYTSNEGKTYYAFMSAGGRMYFDNKASDDTGNRLRRYVDYLLGLNQTDYGSWNATFFNCFRHMYEAKDTSGKAFYQLPEVIKAIFDDPSDEQIVKSSSSLDCEELKSEGLVGMSDKQIMAQLGEEAFSNPEVIDNSIAFMNKYSLFRNEMLNDFKIVNIYPLVWTHSLGALSRQLHPSTDGKAVQRGNVYTYQTSDYTLSTNQAYQPGEYGDQQQIELATLSNNVSVFSLQPMRNSTRENYWVGQGRMPYSVQEKNINVSLFTIPSKAGLLEPHVASFTHTYFPLGLFDESDVTHLSEGYIFGRKNNTYIAVKGMSNSSAATFAFKNEMSGVSEDDLTKDRSKIKTSVKALIEASGNLHYDLILNGGDKQAIVTELSSSKQDASFNAFKTRILANPVSFDASSFALSYVSHGTSLQATYNQSFLVNGVSEDLQYARYESPYVEGGKLARKASNITFAFGGKSLTLDFDHLKREQNA